MEQLVVNVAQRLLREDRQESLFYDNGMIATFSYKDKNLVLLTVGDSKLSFPNEDKEYNNKDVVEELLDKNLSDQDVYSMFDKDLIKSNNWFELFELESGTLKSLEMVWGTYTEAMSKSFIGLVKHIDTVDMEEMKEIWEEERMYEIIENSKAIETEEYKKQEEYHASLNELNNGPNSECCGASYIEGTDLCSECKEHTGKEI